LLDIRRVTFDPMRPKAAAPLPRHQACRPVTLLVLV